MAITYCQYRPSSSKRKTGNWHYIVAVSKPIQAGLCLQMSLTTPTTACISMSSMVGHNNDITAEWTED